MSGKAFPVIDLVATGENIRCLRLERGMTVRDLQNYFGFEEPRAIYKWQKGESLPTVDNLYALGNTLRGSYGTNPDSRPRWAAQNWRAAG